MKIDPMAAAMIISALSDTVITIAAATVDETPEEFKKKMDALQGKADTLEEWLKGAKPEGGG